MSEDKSFELLFCRLVELGELSDNFKVQYLRAKELILDIVGLSDHFLTLEGWLLWKQSMLHQMQQYSSRKG